MRILPVHCYFSCDELGERGFIFAEIRRNLYSSIVGISAAPSKAGEMRRSLGGSSFMGL